MLKATKKIVEQDSSDMEYKSLKNKEKNVVKTCLIKSRTRHFALPRFVAPDRKDNR